MTPISTSGDIEAAAADIELKLTTILGYLTKRGMKMSAEKLKIMCITHKRRRKGDLNITLNGVQVKEVNDNKLLGVTYDSSFTFGPHVDEVKIKLAGRTKVMKMMKGASWGPTQSTLLVLHNCFVVTVIRQSMMAWYPYIKVQTEKEIEVLLNVSPRLITGLPMNTPLESLRIEAGTDTLNQLACKTAASLYTQINPHHQDSHLLIKKYYIEKKPLWAEYYLDPIENIKWNEPIQPTNKRNFLVNDRIILHTGTLNTQEETEQTENLYNYLLYTDASVEQDSNSSQGGRAAIGFAWYEVSPTEKKKMKEGSIYIGHNHSSFSAEAIALKEAIGNIPKEIERTASIGIFTDSLSNILHLNAGVVTATEQKKLVEVLNKVENTVNLHHTKSHVGIIRNEHVDDLCNIKANAVSRKTKEQNGEMTKEQMKESIKKSAIMERKKELIDKMHKKEATRKSKNLSTANSLRYYFNILGNQKTPPKEQKDLERRESVLLSKARTNRWTSCRKFQHKINQCLTDKCLSCPNRTDTTKHQLNKCQDHTEERELLRAKLKYKYTDITDILMTEDKKELALVTEYLKIIDDRNLKKIREKKVIFSIIMGGYIEVPRWEKQYENW